MSNVFHLLRSVNSDIQKSLLSVHAWEQSIVILLFYCNSSIPKQEPLISIRQVPICIQEVRNKTEEC